MASRQDQLHSYQFAVQRLVAALVTRESDPVQSPLRRTAGATMAGLLLAAVSLAGVTVYGVISPGSATGWKKDATAVIVERESGARYVLRDGKLHPVLNFASAVLIVGAQSHVATVSRAALASVPRGTPWGIAGAPDTLPAAGALLRQAWTVCSARFSATGTGTPTTESVLYIGAAGTGGQPLGADDAVLGQTPDGTSYLLWRGSALAIPQPSVVRNALGWGNEPLVPVAAALVNALDAAPDLIPPAIANLGGVSAVPGLRIGTVVVEQNQGGSRQHAVVLAAGLAPISQVAADLLLSDPKLGQTAAHEMAQGDYSRAPQTTAPADAARLPATTPTLRRPTVASAGSSTGICVRPADAGGPPPITIDPALPGAADATRPAGSSPPGAILADRVVVPPGHGALVQAGPTAGTWSLVTELGIRYPLANPGVAALLGYPDGALVRVPSGLVSLLPAGPALDPDAVRPAPGG